MSKEVLYRAVSKKGKWIYGFYYCHKGLDEHFILPIDETPFYNGIPIIPKAISDYEVYKETVSEFTGLTDKNGTKIFEGDILLVGGTQKVVVSFEDGQFVISHYAINLLRDRTLESVVVGNIHDNPELLEEV